MSVRGLAEQELGDVEICPRLRNWQSLDGLGRRTQQIAVAHTFLDGGQDIEPFEVSNHLLTENDSIKSPTEIPGSFRAARPMRRATSFDKGPPITERPVGFGTTGPVVAT